MTSKNIYTGPKVRDTETFIQKAKWRHGDSYDYSEVVYKDSKTAVKIICRKHGVFEQSPSNHYAGSGCKKCYYERAGSYLTPSQEQFIAKANYVHRGLYDYSETKYVRNSEPITIGCRIHGSFSQTPAVHLRGGGCQKCSKVKRGSSRRTTKHTHISRFVERHGDLYDYSLIPEDFLSSDKVQIICRVHGVFLQTPEVHYKSGCPRCRGFGKNTEEVIEEFSNVHGDLYDYSRVEYSGAHEKVIIGCPVHGEFYQSPANHRNGHGCPECATDSKVGLVYTEETCSGRNGFMYFIKMSNDCETFYKIGITSRDSTSYRLQDLSSESKYIVEHLDEVYGTLWDVFVSEQYLHNALKQYSYKPKNSFGGSTECYHAESFDFIKKLFDEIKEMKSR